MMKKKPEICWLLAATAFILMCSYAQAEDKVVIFPYGGTVGNATAADVVKDKTFSSRTAGRGVKGTLELPQHYDIGDTGPAGGIVFYTDEYHHHGLEVAPENLGGGLWGCYYTEIAGADGTAVGTGAQNTVDILAGCNDPSRPPEAAELADNYVLNGYTDWFLPSIDELNELYQSAVVVSSYAPWSSTESYELGFTPDQFAMIVNFTNGIQGPQPKNTPMLVHPIRAF